MAEINDSNQTKQELVESSNFNPVTELFNKGLSSYRKKNIEDAITAFKSIIATNPEVVEAHVNLGNAYFVTDKVKEAIACWKKAINLDPKQVMCYVNIGNAYYMMGEVNNALPHWHVANTIAPDNIKALMNLGAAYEKLKDKFNAFKYYEQYLHYAVSETGTEHRAILKKVGYSRSIALKCLSTGRRFHKIHDYKSAALYYVKAVKFYPNLPKAHLNLGKICYELERYDQAAKYWYQTIKCSPSEENTYCNLAVAYEKLKQYNDAYCLYHRYLHIVKKQSMVNIEIHARMTKIKKYLDKHPDVVRRTLEQADEYYKNRKYYDALWYYENYVILKPDQTDNLNFKITELKNILDPVKKAAKEAYDMGHNYLKEGDYDNAILAFRRSIRLDAKDYHSDLSYKKIHECNLLKNHKKSEKS